MKLPESYAELTRVDTKALHNLWWNLFQSTPIGRNSKLYRPLWYRIQCTRHKRHLDQKYITRLNKYARAPEEYLKSARKIKYELKPGTLIRKTYKGQLFTLRVIADNRFEYNGKTYPSLSAAAYAMIGMKVSGTDFFGLNNKGLKNDQD